jgi:teichuronic acid biosynthesis glycosyltransferase TuaG
MTMITVITPSYNTSPFIGATIDSVLSQCFTSWEMIIVDDCSTDDSIDIIESYVVKDSRIKLIKLFENSGAAIARNIAIEAASGRYIAFLDSDDIWLSNKLEKQLYYMLEKDIVFSYSAYNKVDEQGHIVGEIGVPDKIAYRHLLKVCSIGCLTAIYDTHKLGKVYMPLVRKRQDLGLWLRILKQTDYAYATPGILAQYRVRSNSISANKRVAAQYTWKLYREVERLSFVKSLYYFSHYTVNGVLRTKLPKLARILGVLR